MAASISYVVAFLFTILLFLSYTAIDQHTYYSAPIGIDPDFGRGFIPGMFLFGAVETENTTFRAYELAMAPHAPINTPGGPPGGDARPHLTGPIRAIDPEDDAAACGSLVNSNLTGGVVLVRRGKCDLFVKISNCQSQGAKAVLINNELTDESWEPELDRKSMQMLSLIKIPGLIVSQSDFTYMLSHTDEDATIWTLAQEVDSNLVRMVLTLFIRPIIMFTIILLVVFINYHGNKAKKRSPPDLVWSLPRREWDPNREGVWHQRQCSICLEDFSERCDIMTLPCSHEFHVQCISQWLLRRRGVCPLCFQEVQNETTPLLAHASS